MITITIRPLLGRSSSKTGISRLSLAVAFGPSKWNGHIMFASCYGSPSLVGCKCSLMSVSLHLPIGADRHPGPSFSPAGGRGTARFSATGDKDRNKLAGTACPFRTTVRAASGLVVAFCLARLFICLRRRGAGGTSQTALVARLLPDSETKHHFLPPTRTLHRRVPVAAAGTVMNSVG